MNKNKILKEIVEIIEPYFIKNGFNLKGNKIFEKKEGDNIFQYEIDLKPSKNHYSLHLKLSLLNKKIRDFYNLLMKQVLTDEQIIFPKNWTQKDIEYSVKGRSTGKKIAMLTDWRKLKEENETLEEFNSKFSIWLYAFGELNEKENYKEQLLLSGELALQWFENAKTKEYLIKNTDLFGLCVLKMNNKNDELKSKFDSIIERMESQKQNTKEVELFFKYLEKEL